MRILDTILRLLPYQRDMLDADIPADTALEWCRRPRRGIRLVSSHPCKSNVVRGFSGHVAVDEFNPICIDMEQPSDAERCCGWRIISQEEVQP